MRRLCVLLLAGGVGLSCVGSAAKARPAVAAPPKTPAWANYTVALAGVRAAFPSPPDELSLSQDVQGTNVHSAGLYLERESHSYFCGRVWIPGRDRESDEAALKRAASNLAKPGARVTHVERDGFRGIALDGVNESGKSVRARVFAIGDGTVLAVVLAPAGKLDPKAADQFLSQCAFSMPWRVYASPEGEFTVTVPAVAIELDRAKNPEAGLAVARAFVVGGIDETAYYVASAAIDWDTRESASDDDLLDRISDRLGSENGHERWSGPIEVDGARGRDISWRDPERHFRWRVFVTQTHLYQLGVMSRSKELVRGEAATRFLGSMRRAPAD